MKKHCLVIFCFIALLTSCAKDIKVSNDINHIMINDLQENARYMCIQGPYIDRKQFENLSGINVNLLKYNQQDNGTVLWISIDKEKFHSFKLKGFYYDKDYKFEKIGNEHKNICVNVAPSTCIRFDKPNHLFGIGVC